MTARCALPDRRGCERFEISFGGLVGNHVVDVGFYDDGSIGEVFITGGKSGEQIQAIARDFAIVLSLALQHGVQLQTIAHALTRDSQGHAQSIGGAVIDRLTEMAA
jgi:hypothetical protein